MAEERYAAGTYHEEMRLGWRRISWGAIWAGLFVTLAVYITLNLLGAGIGAVSIGQAENAENLGQGLGIGAGIWWFLSGLISLFIGGWFAGRLSAFPHKSDRALQGIVVWALMYLIMFWLLTTALASIVGGAASLLGKTVSAVGQGASQSTQLQQAAKQTLQQYGLTPEMLQQEVQSALGPNTPQNQQQGVSDEIKNYLEGQRTPQERQQLVQALSQKTGKPPQEIDRMITKMEQGAQQAQQKGQQVKEQAKEAGQTAANVTGGAAIGLAISMILGAIVAGLGGAVAKGPYFVEPHRR